ncbi:hypothetical protein ACLIA0_07235 [Bacillaceae bacterium W0354]
MALTLTATLTMIVGIGYLTMQNKGLHKFEQWFSLFSLIMLYTGYTSIISVNLELWELSEKGTKLLAMRVSCVVFVPLTILWSIDRWTAFSHSLIKRCLLLAFYWLILYIGDLSLRVNDVYVYKNWNVLLTFLGWISLFAITVGFQTLFRKLLKKEGVSI